MGPARPPTDPLRVDTLPVERVAGPARPEGAATVLTILFHPHLERVGERARLLRLSATPLSRIEPLFAATGATEGAPLADPGVSRKPVHLEPLGGAVRIRADAGSSVRADGVPVAGAAEWPSERLAEGVVLELGGRVVLLLHEVPELDALPVERIGTEALGLVGASAAMERLRADVRRVADLDVPVLIRGESGSGKELVARAIHGASRRHAGPLVAVNVAAVPPSMAAAELFGHVRGAFTGAADDRQGHFAAAHGGTLFLDEIGDVPADVQVALLRVLETGEVQPVGARTASRVDVRVVAATDADLDRDVIDGRFRRALLERLAGFQIRVPPLRERRDDIGRLLAHFLRAELEGVGEAHRLEATDARAEPWLAASLAARLARHDWPGNVRQLRNAVRQIVVASRWRPHAVADAAVERLLEAVAPAGDAEPAERPEAPRGSRKPTAVSDAELVASLRAHGFQITATAKTLGMSRNALLGRIDGCPLLRRPRDLTAAEIERCRKECAGDLERMSERLEVSTRGPRLRMRELGLD
jgi:two-component system nitrogen regulation response regulator GlnG